MELIVRGESFRNTKKDIGLLQGILFIAAGGQMSLFFTFMFLRIL